jgi:hypothetical protein
LVAAGFSLRLHRRDACATNIMETRSLTPVCVPTLRADTWVRSYGGIAGCLQIGIIPFGKSCHFGAQGWQSKPVTDQPEGANRRISSPRPGP